MRLNNKFDALWKAVRRITEQTTDFSLDIQSNWVVPEYERIAIELKSGKDITISEVEIQNGLLTYKGQHVVLYIRDHGFKYERAIHDENERNKYHVADCGAITNLKNAGRFERLIATTNTSEKFLITGTTSSYRNTQQESTVRLRVCKACLIKLNYNNYNKSLEKYSIYEYFDLEEFFKSYSSFFKQLPSAASKINNSSVYADNWKQISKARKTLTGYCCQNCGVDLSKHPGLLHTHHINGVKSDNNFKNLKVLCIECHKAQPSHTHLKISTNDLKTLIDLRNEQRHNLLAQKAKANSKNTLNYGVQKLNGLNNSTRQQEQKTHQPSSTSILGDYSSQSSQQSNYQNVSPQTANSVREEQKTVLPTQNQDHKNTANRDHVAASKLSAVISTQSQANKDTETKDHEAASKPDAVISTQNQDHKDTANRDHVAASKPGAVISNRVAPFGALTPRIRTGRYIAASTLLPL
ncbi:HNH endonuclease [Anaerobiospirillum succiniciproducens]|uniref:HNH endonuclease n=1 Tax=Anaerobiospirillum succiniciproducens TaxID=13335 RepID=UPI0023559D33|nr:HNH endonuclease [Anaerobiospirillum succiniciproducens]MCI6863042.1 HNH endonuclease [Anaerobiospirillum succiniciproducens]